MKASKAKEAWNIFNKSSKEIKKQDFWNYKL